MRGAVEISGVNAALRHALTPVAPALDNHSISSAMYAIARDCGWTITSFFWRPIHCTFHLSFASTEKGPIAVAIGADAPIVALSCTSKVNDELRYFDDTAFSSASTGYARNIQVLDSADLKRELSQADRAWLVARGNDMDYNLKYWRPRTAGEVIFNTWD